MNRRQFAVSALALAVTAMAGCESATVPSEVLGIYTLAAVDGQALPAPLGAATDRQLIATKGNLILRANGEYFQVIESQFRTDDGQLETGVNATEGTFSVRGGSIELRETLGSLRRGTIASGEIRYEIPVARQPVKLLWQFSRREEG